ncbi:MAG: nucleotidyltransferase family protein [Myxococcaceae bacterium]
MPSLLDLFRVLSSFAPARTDLSKGPWEQYVDWAIAQGLAPLAAYNLEYRLGGAGAPAWARDRMLSIYQGSLNDNVMKLVNFKRAIDGLEGRKVVLLGAATFAESLYPHVGFRPVLDIRVLVPPMDVDPFSRFLGQVEMVPTDAPQDLAPAEQVLSDGRTMVFVHGKLTGDRAIDKAVIDRSLPNPVYGPSARKLSLEDAVLAHVLLIARANFEVPMLEWIDLRELLLGAPSTGAFAGPPDAATLNARVKEWKLGRPFYAALSVAERLFPELEKTVAPLKPELSWPVRELIDRLLVTPVSQVGRTEGLTLEEPVRHALAGA